MQGIESHLSVEVGEVPDYQVQRRIYSMAVETGFYHVHSVELPQT
jgi:hypothetical protein